MARCVLTLAAVFSASAILIAQDQPAVFRTAARLVRVNVTVTDSRGEPVTDLRVDDFAIREAGTLRDIALFRFEGGETSSVAPRALAPGVFTNQVQFTGGPPRNVTAVLLDAANTSIVDNWDVRSQLVSYLKTSLTPDTRLVIYSLGDRLTPVVDFTDDAALLRSHLDQMLVTLPPIIPFREDRIRLTLGALDAVGRHLEGIPGRKSVVWISGGFSMFTLRSIPGAAARGMGPMVSIDGVETDVRRMAQSLAQRGVTLYIVNARGLRSGRQDVSAPLLEGGGAILNMLRWASEFNNGLNGTMTTFAATTGGKYLFNTNDLTVGLKTAFDDLKASYSLGFYAADADDKWHPLEVRVNRPGLTVRSRQGWIADAEQPASAPVETEAWKLAIADPLGSSAIQMSARCQPASNDAAGPIELILRIDANTVAFQREANMFVSTLDVATLDRTADGGWRPSTQRVTVEWDDTQLAEGRRQGIVYVRTWTPQADVTSIRVSVLDRNSGQYGTLDMPMSKVLAAGAN